MTTPSCELRVLGLDLWKNRRVSAYELGRFKYKWLFGAVLALVVPVVFLLAVGVALVV